MKVFNFVRFFAFGSLALLFLSINNFAAPVVRQGAGANPAAIQAVIDQFRADLGGVNNGGAPNSFTSGRREINWDGAPDGASSPNNFSFAGFRGRGAIFNTVSNFAGDNPFILSADSSNPTNAAINYGDIDPSYTNTFRTFSPERLFVARGSNVIEVLFVVPGTSIPATVSGFGSVFTDVDDPNNTFIEFFDAAGKSLGESTVPGASNGLSFLGISFNAGERIGKVVIKLGNAPLAAGNVDGQNGVDVVATDDFIYGEPRVIGHHANDFDGDGQGDFAVFRPSNGGWFVLNSGSNTLFAKQFGQNGDLPVDGDFDGDSRSDLAVFRPSVGSWFVLNSSDGQFVGTQFGQNGDKPVAGDYDKDGKADFAVWRPDSGTYFFLRSTNGQVGITQWGTNGDIPIGSASAPY